MAVCKHVARKYTRSKVRKALPVDFAYIIEELMTEARHGADKNAYSAAIIDAVIRTAAAARFIEELCLLLQRLAIDHLHRRRYLRPRPAPGCHHGHPVELPLA